MLKQLNDTINYIEEHLLDEKVIDEAMKRVSVSELHFKNVFFFLTGMSINEYVKNRRLSEANYDLLHGKKVTDIAFKYGYQSMDGFTRAFKNWCGFLPSEISRRGEHEVFPKFNFIVKVSGGNSITQEQREEMHRLQNMEPFEVVNVSYNSDTEFKKEEGYLTHLIGVLTTEKEIGAGLETLPMKAGTWAVFPNEGEFPSTLQNTMARIYAEWFMTADYELAESISFSFTK